MAQVDKKHGWCNVGDLRGCVHFKVVAFERIRFLVIALKNSIELYAWAPRPYHKWMVFKSFTGALRAKQDYTVLYSSILLQYLCFFEYASHYLHNTFNLVHFKLSDSRLTLLYLYYIDLVYQPLLVDLTVEEGHRLKVLYASANGFHAIDIQNNDPSLNLYTPKEVRRNLNRHTESTDSFFHVLNA